MTRRMGDQAPSGFGPRLKQLREEAGLSQQDLAVKTPCSVFTVSKLERGTQEPAWPLVIAFCKALGVSCEAFQQAEGAAEPAAEKAGPGRPRKAEGAPEPSGQKPKKRGKGGDQR
jgi:DNA-binding XRE family transcriptional regulator